MDQLPALFATTRASLQRVAVHVIARRRHDLTGRFGLRPTPGGVGAPAAGPEHEVLRTSGAWLLRERTGTASRTTVLDLATASLAEAAAFAEVDLARPFAAGHDTPLVGDPHVPLGVDGSAARALGRWYAVGAAVLDQVVAGLDPLATPSVAQLWPEHFDLAADVGVGADQRANLGASPGDGDEADPYLYVGPWGPERPGDAGYWNAPFGAVLRYADLRAAPDPVAAGVAFFQAGLDRLRAGAPSS